MLNALSLTRGALTWIYPTSIVGMKQAVMRKSILYAYARCLREARDTPLAELAWGVERRDVRVLNERLADDAHSELLHLLDVVRGVLLTAVWQRQDGNGDERRRLRHLVEPTTMGEHGQRCGISEEAYERPNCVRMAYGRLT